jgi:hypothetical protein
MPFAIPPEFAATGLHFAPGPVAATRFQVIGERSSGTNFVKRMLGRNTPLKATEALGWKHGHVHALAIPADLVVVVSVRRAEDWVRSMFAKPWHATPALQALTFPDFLRAPWETVIDRPRYFDGLPWGDQIGQPLQLDRDPLTGLPYAHLLALRRGKLMSHLSLMNRGCALCLVRMEEVSANPDRFVASFRAAFGLPAQDGPVRPVLKRLGARFTPAVDNRPAAPETLSEDDATFIHDACDPGLERLLGYRT